LGPPPRRPTGGRLECLGTGHGTLKDQAATQPQLPRGSSPALLLFRDRMICHEAASR